MQKPVAVVDANSYQQQASVTAKYTKEIHMSGYNHLYPTLGLINEYIYELKEKINLSISGAAIISDEDILAECGDVYWYIATICSEFNIKLSSIFDALDVNDNYEQGVFACGKIAGYTKKLMRDSTNKPDIAFIEKVIAEIKIIASCVNYVVLSCGGYDRYTPYYVMDMNLEKLYDRLNRGTIHGSGDKR